MDTVLPPSQYPPSGKELGEPKPIEYIPRVNTFDTRKEMGEAVAERVAGWINDAIREKGRVVVCFAAAPSQDEFLEALSKKDIDWSKVVAVHLDEYPNLLTERSKNSFKYYLNEHLFDKVKPGKVYFMADLKGTPEEVCQQYTTILDRLGGIDIGCIGEGENGHIGFNDPPVADFNDPKTVKVVELDERCRTQQFNDYRDHPDRRYESIDEVPTRAITMTVPAILSARKISVVVPGSQKAEAVKNALEGPITTLCPASSLRTHPHVEFFLDREAASMLSKV